MSELPSGWQFALLGEIGSVQSGVGFPNEYQGSTSGTYPVYKVGDVSRGVTQNNGKLQLAKNYVSSETAELLKGHIFEPGSTLFAKIGEALKLNRRGFVITPGLADNNVMGYKSVPGISDHFIYYFLLTQDFAQYSRSTTVPSIRKGDIEEVQIALPPGAEQIRIAQKLDELLAQVDTLKARIDTIPALLKRFRQSVLAAAVSGRLTEKWREVNSASETGLDVIKRDQLAKLALLEEQPELKKKKSSIQSDIDEDYLFAIPEGWAFTTWGKISEWITYGFTRPIPKSESGKKLLTAKDVQRFALELVECGLTTTDAFESLSDKDRPQNGDLLITKDGSIGRAALVRTEEDFCINQSVAVCWLRSTAMNKSYLELLSNSDFTQRFVLDKAQGMAIQHLSIIDFAKCPVPVPPRGEQDEIVRSVEQLFAFADQLEAKVATAQARIDRLTQSILAKAFRGELAPQDPNDEPASLLLERIQAQRAAAPKAKRGRKSA